MKKNEKQLTSKDELQKDCVAFLLDGGLSLNFKNYLDHVAPDDPWGHVQLMKFYTKAIAKYELSLEEVMEQLLLVFNSLTAGGE